MALLIGQACSNEYGDILNGQKGDQTQREVRINTFFDGQVWQTIYRCKDAAKRKLIAKYMKDACLNDNIGYDTGNTRYSCWDEAMKVKSTSGITKPCNTDCSQLMCICVNLAGIPVTKYLWTAIEDELLMSTGMFDRITDQSVLRGNGLRQGDILLRSGHTAVVVEADEQSGADKTPKWVGEAYGKKLIPVYANSTGAMALPEYPALAVGNLFDVCDESDNRYYIRIAWEFYGWFDKQFVLRKSPYKTGNTTSDLHLRQNAGTGYKSLAIMPKGTTVQICDVKNASDGRPWDYIIYNGMYGFASDKYIK
nr:MAG TPA: hydrolase [Bacteriophage sp.]